MKPINSFYLLLFALLYCFTVYASTDTQLARFEYRAAVDYFLQHGKTDDLHRYEEHHADPRWQAMLNLTLASTLLDGGSQLQIAKKLLLQSLATKPSLTTVSQQDAYIKLGILEEKFNNQTQAKFYYQQAMAHGSAIACNYLGVLFEQQNNYAQAKNTYQSCIPDRVSPLLLMNLGTLYYNGLGVEQDRKKGADFWKQSFVGFPYDPDVNYNLGIYNQQIINNPLQARYHYALAAQLGDSAAKEKLQHGSIANEDASSLFSAEFLKKDRESFNRLLSDRIFYLSGQTRIDGEMNSEHVTIGHCQDIIGLCITGNLTDKNIMKYIKIAFDFYYVDDINRLFMVNLNSPSMKKVKKIKWPNSLLKIVVASDGFYSISISPLNM